MIKIQLGSRGDGVIAILAGQHGEEPYLADKEENMEMALPSFSDFPKRGRSPTTKNGLTD